MLGWSFLALSAVLVIVAIADVPFQLWDYARNLRMTRQEVKDEMKDSEGRPEVKNRIRMLQRELAENRMVEAVPAPPTSLSETRAAPVTGVRSRRSLLLIAIVEMILASR